MDILLVSHFHWDREWYRAFEDFRSHLVDAIDAVLDLVDADPGFRFVLDGQSIVLDDYLEVRPEQRARLEAGIRSGRLAAGPWYVQPDSLLPAGETHVRNLLLGRAIAESLGGCSRVAYVPDSFGHPAQFPQLFAGFGLDPFVYWRGNGNELDELGPLYRWRAPDGSTVTAWWLSEGYFGAGGLDADGDVHATATRLQQVIDRIAATGVAPILLMNGFDHLPADSTTAAIAAEVGAERVLLDDAAARLPDPHTLPEFTGELTGARHANLLPGVWSARMPLKLRNRQLETLLTAWAEPWAAFGELLGCTSERAALDRAWRLLVQNQAHDSIGGCSIDPVHERMEARYDDAEGLGRATLTRVLERLAGRDTIRTVPWDTAQEVVVFNASPFPRTDIVRVPLDGYPPWRVSLERFDFHPLSQPNALGLAIDGEPVRVVPSDDPNRVRFLANHGGFDAEFVARDVPAFGCRRYRLEPAPEAPDDVDGERAIAAGGVRVHANDDGTLDISFGGRTFLGCFGIDDATDRGDSYDADPDPPRFIEATTNITRARHPSGIQRLRVSRMLDSGWLTVDATVADGVPFVRCEVEYGNYQADHRLRLRFPTGGRVERFVAATTFDEITRTVAPPDDTGWQHRAPRTFPHQGWIAVNGLVVGAPGLPEAEVTEFGDILVTLVRSVGMLAKLELRTRPMPAGPEMPAPGAQVRDTVRATIVLADDPVDARAGEVGLVGVIGDSNPVLDAEQSLFALAPSSLVLSALKPAADGNGIVVRVLNPAGSPRDAELTFGFDLRRAVSVRLDETPDGKTLDHNGRTVRMRVGAHELRSVRVLCDERPW